MIIDGALYLRGCETRTGPYPYCRHLRHGVHSVTKSLGAAIALLRLAQTDGDQVLALKIKDYVTVTTTHNGWEQVTFGDAINMATGIGNLAPQREPNRPFADENTPQIVQWHTARTAKDKLAISFAAGHYPWRPGEVLRYNRTHTFVLAAAMDSFLKRQQGAHAQLWDMVMAEVLRPIWWYCCPMGSRPSGSPMGTTIAWIRWCWQGRPSAPSPVRQSLRRHRRPCASRSWRASCVPKCPGTPSTDPL
jgi:hypothetical protein